MNRTVILTLATVALLGACSDHKPTTMAAASPELLSAQPAPPVVEAPPVALPPLPSVNAGDATASPAPEKPTPVDAAIDSPATDPKGTLTKGEETNSMPEAAHGNNHSSPSLESRPSDSSAPK